ncbi:Protein trichome birefringence-like 26 [Ananas comosus]|uniref:Protein trichome birefringence-like 26 n=2 Tax=Ananas comosus TaxID=4615 RepID=A0A199W0K8_ANACO|nr:Protein trichome birefringence-like 26 [Ananas comosus]CAD1824064.1 unnamed protein product [Ananas comosus var. bracteatus]
MSMAEEEKEKCLGDGSSSSPPSTTIANHTLTKVLGFALLGGFCAYLVFSASGGSFFPSDPSDDGDVDGGCNFFAGSWISNPSGPAYTNASCKYIDPPNDCMTNGRPDREYLYWRWKPQSCDLPRANAEKFLNAMRNKAWGLVGDSIFRNQHNSWLCLLSQVEEATDIYHDEDYQSRTWYFPSYNFTLALLWAPFLLKAEVSRDASRNYDIKLHLDALERTWTNQYSNFDYIIISGGQWFLKTTMYLENNTIVGCHNCPEKDVKDLGFDYAYRKALQLSFNFIIESDHKPLVLFRTWLADHFEYGEWYSGGVCNRTEPYKAGEFNGDATDNMMWRLEVEEFKKAAAIGSKNRTRLKLFDTYHLSLLRPDGHPGPYRKLHPDLSKKPQNDCLHWCLPGPVDTWNDLATVIALNEEDSRSSSMK